MDAPTPTTRDVLTQEEAAARAARISDVHYLIDLDLLPKAVRYRGDVTITFRVTGEGPTFLDFTGSTIDLLEVDGVEQTSPDWNAYRIGLPALAEGEHRVRLVYQNEYNHTGSGLHQFVDPEDGEEYLYTNFEPFEAHWVFPGFDQPDIKAQYTLAVTAPASWVLIANGREASSETAPDGRRRVWFHRTRTFSTYLFALIAGPYEVFRDAWEDVPLGFYARRSLAPYVDRDELFEVTRQGLTFFSDFFGYRYPFEKYDQVFVPEFNAGAMENVAAVTHTERLVFRDPPTDNDRLDRAEVILHEMAHMWFGNLVTMRWWNDLWLNESFATYMSYLAMDEATRFTSGWQVFNSGMKNWAYTEDQRVTTHPIAGVVRDTDETFLNFDGITYGKGASVIKQLVAAIGLTSFREGMRHYFAHHEFGNTTLADWLDSLGEGAGRSLHPWARAWLETASLNTIAATVEHDGHRVSALTLAQTAPPEYPTLRPHTLEVALVRDDGGALVIDAIPATLEGATAEVAAAIGKMAPALTFPNYGDHGYFKVALDEPSIAFVREHLERIDDPLLRMLIWHTLWTMVRDQQLKSTDFLDLAMAKVTAERDHNLIESILGRMTAAVSRYVPEAQKGAAAHRMFLGAWDALHAAGTSDLQIIWGRTLFGLALNREDVVFACEVVDGKHPVAGFTVDQDMRWSAAISAVAHGLDGAWGRVEAEHERDRSDRGQRAMIRAEVSKPDPVVKRAAWERFGSEDGYGSLHLTAAAMGGFHWWIQAPLLEPYVEEYFQWLPQIFEERENEFAQRFFNNLWPGYRVEPALHERAQRLIAEHGERLPTLKRQLQEADDDLMRALRCREFAVR